jgi:phenylacetate-coenzyme A ligase PaaK-like adenylate-forming protein
LDTFKSFVPKIYHLNDQEFVDIALQIFRFQAEHNPVYRQFIAHLGVEVSSVRQLEMIPYLPVSFFKSQVIKTGNWDAATIFTSSGTTQQQTSRHYVENEQFYLRNAALSFQHFFGDLENYHFLALLPSYLERKGSSLISMIQDFIERSRSPWSGFYLNNIDKLLEDVSAAKSDGRRTILWGVSFALLDLAECGEIDLSHCIIVETGGMKGRRKEITRRELHEILNKRLNAREIYSEYGMTELFSQAYTGGGQVFRCPPWMRVIGRDLTDPLTKGLMLENAGLNVIDLANVSTISFIETEDLAKIHTTSTFEIMGRIDNSDIRGCNLLI